MTWLRHAPLAIVAALLAVTRAPEARDQAPPGAGIPVDAVVRAATAYVSEYQRQFAFLVADERYEQRQLDASGREVERRTIRGELFMTYLPADGVWIAVRDVAEVDGQPIDDGEDLRRLLQQRESLRGLAQRIAARNARFNIGGVERNFNEPTLPLLLLDPKRVEGLRFERTRVTTDGDATLVTLAFTERGRPTLVRGRRGPAPSRGEMVIEATSGRVRLTAFELRDDPVTARLVTTYGHDRKLDLWVPQSFSERYEARRGRERERVECDATYTNYRRFQVTGRIK